MAKLQEVVDVILSSSPTIRRLTEDMNKLVSHVDDAECQEFLQSISPLSFLEKHKSNCAKYQPGTRAELIEHVVSRLFDGSNKVIWCKSGPGGGKTLLISAVIERLKQFSFNNQANTGFLYCDYREHNQQNRLRWHWWQVRPASLLLLRPPHMALPKRLHNLLQQIPERFLIITSLFSRKSLRKAGENVSFL